MDIPIGRNLARLRHMARLTQEELAERAECSVDVIRRLEQGARETARIVTLYDIANALDAPVSALFDGPGVLTQPPGRRPEEPRILALRRVLAPVEASTARPLVLPTLPELRRSVAEAWRLYRAGDFSALGTLLPPLITTANAAADDATDDDDRATARVLASDAYNIAGAVLIQLGYIDLAMSAGQRATASADASGDLRTRAIAATATVWALIRQGRLDEAQRVAVRAADEVEPRFGESDPARLHVWGGLLDWITTTAGRSGRTDEANEALALMQSAADRIGHDRRDDRIVFGPTWVSMRAVSMAVEQENDVLALTLSRRVAGNDHVPVVSRTRYMLDVAHAHVRQGQEPEAVRVLRVAHRMAPEWIPHQTLARELLRVLLERRGRGPRRVSGLQELADAVGVQ